MTLAHRALQAALIAAALASAPAFAGGDIVKCVDAEGKVTITDSQCGSGVSKVVVPAALNTAPGETVALAPKPLRVSVQRVALTPAPVVHDNFIDPRPRSKMMARDAATLRAARTSLR